MPDADLRTYRQRTGRLMRVTLALWALFALCIPVLVVPLNAFSFLMTTQGALVALTLVLCAFARRQGRVDRDHFPTPG